MRATLLPQHFSSELVSSHIGGSRAEHRVSVDSRLLIDTCGVATLVTSTIELSPSCSDLMKVEVLGISSRGGGRVGGMLWFL